MKKLLKYFSFSLLLIIIACVPKPKLKPPPLYEGKKLTLEDIITKAGTGIDSLKAISNITVEKNNKRFSAFSASAIVRKPGQVHMRIYQLGILARDFVIMDDRLYVLSGKKDLNLKNLGREMYNAIFWWEDIDGASLNVTNEKYVVRSLHKEVYLDRDTLLPVKQVLNSEQGLIVMQYKDPKETDGYWYDSKITINLNEFRFTVKLKKLIKNPEPGEADFRVP